MLAYGRTSLDYQDIQLNVPTIEAPILKNPENEAEENKGDEATNNLIVVVKLLEAHMEKLFLNHGFD